MTKPIVRDPIYRRRRFDAKQIFLRAQDFQFLRSLAGGEQVASQRQ